MTSRREWSAVGVRESGRQPVTRSGARRPALSTGSTVRLPKIDLDGGSTWHAANRKPDYLPAPSEEWPLLPTGCLVLGGEERHWLESADWLVGGVRFSQIGGLPTWIQEARYPDCLECGRAMPFIAQLSNEDIEEYGEGIYYMFACTDCGVAATGYQQS
jgi:hypothetical protein